MCVIKLERQHQTVLNDDQYRSCLKLVKLYVAKNGSIRNSQLRDIASIGYDQAIRFFKRATREGVLVRKGIASGTHYISKVKGKA